MNTKSDFRIIWPYALTAICLALLLMCISQWSNYKVYGKIPIEGRINALQWRIEDLEEYFYHTQKE